jgi:hypothetical protein
MDGHEDYKIFQPQEEVSVMISGDKKGSKTAAACGCGAIFVKD